MANALFIGWGPAVRGREMKSVQVFDEAIRYWDGLVQSGEVESYETYLLNPHGGDLAGFLIAKGDPEKLARLQMSDEFNRINIRAGTVVENLGVVSASTGAELQQLFQMYTQVAQDLF